MSTGYDVYGGWEPTTLLDLVEIEAEPYITPVGVTPEWVTQLRAAAEECRAGHPAGPPPNGFCGVFGCRGVVGREQRASMQA